MKLKDKHKNEKKIEREALRLGKGLERGMNIFSSSVKESNLFGDMKISARGSLHREVQKLAGGDNKEEVIQNLSETFSRMGLNDIKDLSKTLGDNALPLVMDSLKGVITDSYEDPEKTELLDNIEREYSGIITRLVQRSQEEIIRSRY